MELLISLHYVISSVFTVQGLNVWQAIEGAAGLTYKPMTQPLYMGACSTAKHILFQGILPMQMLKAYIYLSKLIFAFIQSKLASNISQDVQNYLLVCQL